MPNSSKTNYRTKPFYKKLDTHTATAYAEGFCEGENATEEEQLCAWQHLVDTGTAWQLQGWFGRTANNLIERGIIRPSHKRK